MFQRLFFAGGMYAAPARHLSHVQRSATTLTATEKAAIAQAIQSGVETLAVAGA